MSSKSVRTHRRTRVVVGLLAVVGLVGAGPAMSATADTGIQQVSASAATPVPANVTLLKTSTSLLGEHHWYQQVLDGYPVVGGLYAQHVGTSAANNGRITIWDGRVSVGALDRTDATVTSSAAVEAAAAYTGGSPLSFVAPSLWVLPGASARLVWKVTTVTSAEVGASHVSYVDATTARVLQSTVESRSDEGGDYVTGKARTFDPNPVVKLQDQDLTDQNDSNDAVPNRGYSDRTLGHLDQSHTLVGKWAKVVNTDLASSPNDEYFFKRRNEYFEQVMAYYGLDTLQSYYQELGFTDVNAEPQKIETNTIEADNSFYSPSQDLIVMGAGGVDDAEDPEVTWHEAGHATQDDQVPGFGSSPEAGAIGEAYGDYIAVTMSQEFGKDTEVTPTWCVMDWDATSYTDGPMHCLRTTIEDKSYPEDLVGQVHEDGEIWSHAIWDMNVSLGRDRATTAIVEATFSFAPDIDMPDAARLTVQTTKTLYGKRAAAKARTAFRERGIL